MKRLFSFFSDRIISRLVHLLCLPKRLPPSLTKGWIPATSIFEVIYLSLLVYAFTDSAYATPLQPAELRGIFEAQEVLRPALTAGQSADRQRPVSLFESFFGRQGPTAEVRGIFEAQEALKPALTAGQSADYQRNVSLFESFFGTQGPTAEVRGIFEAQEALRPALTAGQSADYQRNVSLFESFFGTQGPTAEVRGLFEAQEVLRPALTPGQSADYQRNVSLFESFFGTQGPTAEVRGLFEAQEALKPAFTAGQSADPVSFFESFAGARGPTFEVRGLFEAQEALKPAFTAGQSADPVSFFESFAGARGPTFEVHGLFEAYEALRPALTGSQRVDPVSLFESFAGARGPTAEVHGIFEAYEALRPALTADQKADPISLLDSPAPTAEEAPPQQEKAPLFESFIASSDAVPGVSVPATFDLLPPSQGSSPLVSLFASPAPSPLGATDPVSLGSPYPSSPYLTQWGAFDLLNLNTNAQLTTLFSNRSAEECCSHIGEACGCTNRDLWVAPLGYFYNQKGCKDQVGFKARMGGVAAGFNFCQDNGLLIGVGIAYTSVSVRWDRHRGHGDLEKASVGVYADYVSDHFVIDGAILGSFCHVHTGGHSSIKHSNQGYDWNAHLGMQSPIQWGRCYISPFGKIDCSNLYQNGFHGRGADNVRWDVKGHHASLLRCELGIAFASSWKMGNHGCFEPRIWLSGVNECYLDTQHYRARAEQSPYQVKPFHHPIYLFSPGIALTFNLNRGFSLSLRYGAELNHQVQTQKVDGRIEWFF
jgi:outer membrane autotransporter protein